MLDKILRLGKEAAIYGLSSLVGRFLNFLLVPFYTNVLLTAEYGVIANLYSYIAFVMILYGYGMDAAYMRFVASPEIGDKKQTFTTPFLSLAATSLLFSTLLHLFSEDVSVLIGMTRSDGVLVQYAAWILFFDALVLIPFSYLRMENKAGTFATIRILNIVMTIILNIILIVGLKMKAEGVLIANLVASFLTFVIHLKFILPNISGGFLKPLYKELLKFGIPYIPAGLASIAMQVIDRPILKALTNDATVGIYQANYRLGIFMMLVVGMFDYAWRPFFLQHAGEKDAKILFSRVFTIFCILAVSLFLVLTLFIEDLLHVRLGGIYFIHPDYWSGVAIVPVVLLAYLFNGAYVNFVIGIYLEKKTSYLAWVFGAAALVNVAANLLLIPVSGMMGAAYATLLSYMVLAVGIYFASRKFYPLEYEWGKIARLSAITVIPLIIFYALPMEPATAVGVLEKVGLVVLFGVLLVVGRVLNPDDLRKTGKAIGGLIGRNSDPQ
jgi:O-antigen/teichoic acid export membrane protein